MKVLIPGRFQPLHKGHEALIQSVLDEGHDVTIGLRDGEGECNPYSASERLQMFNVAFGDKVSVTVLPKFDEIVYGRDVGYRMREIRLDPKIEAISGSNIRVW